MISPPRESPGPDPAGHRQDRGLLAATAGVQIIRSGNEETGGTVKDYKNDPGLRALQEGMANAHRGNGHLDLLVAQLVD